MTHRDVSFLNSAARLSCTYELNSGDDKIEAIDLMQISSADSWSIQQCLEQLDIHTRKVILQSYYFGFSHSELAQLFKTPLGTIKTRIRSGLKSLSLCLQ